MCVVSFVFLALLCLIEKGTNFLRPGTTILRPGSTKKYNKTRNAYNQPINQNYRRSAQFTYQAPGTIDKAAHESSRVTLTSTSTMHTASTPNPGLHRTHPAGSSLESFEPTQLSSRCRRAQPHSYTDNTRNSGDTRHLPPGAGRHHEELVVSHGRAA